MFSKGRFGVFANFLIGLREGLEAALVTGMLIAILVKTNQRHRLPALWTGVIVAIALALGFGTLLTLGPKGLTFEAQEMIGGSLSIIAVAFVTWMVFWMGKTSKHLNKELTEQITKSSGSFMAIALVSFLAVGREGLETALFLWASTRVEGQNQISSALIAAVIGILVAIVLAWVIMRGAIKLNMKQFFAWTGGLLIVIAAGIFSYGIHDLQEAAILPGLYAIVFDVSAYIPPSSWYGTLLKGFFNFSPAPTVLEVCGYWLYLVPVMVLYMRSIRQPAH